MTNERLHLGRDHKLRFLEGYLCFPILGVLWLCEPSHQLDPPYLFGLYHFTIGMALSWTLPYKKAMFIYKGNLLGCQRYLAYQCFASSVL